MARFIIKLLVTVVAIIATAVKAQPTALQPISPAALTGRSIFDKFTLGFDTEGAKIIYTYQYQQSFDSVQSEISLDYDYPSALDNSDSSEIITQVTLYVEAGDGATTQAYVTQGGIGENHISLQIVAQNSDTLRYMIVIYGKEM